MQRLFKCLFLLLTASLWGCAVHQPPLPMLPALSPLNDAPPTLYQAPTVHCTYVASHVNSDGLVVGGHMVYWVNQGQGWSVLKGKATEAGLSRIEPYTPKGEK